MPAWLQTPPVPTLASIGGDLPVTLFNNEAVVVNEASQATALVNAQGVIGEVISFGTYIQFSGAPGTFTVLVQVANSNSADGNYITIDTISAVDPVNFNARSDYASVNAKLVRFKVGSLQNSVTLFAQIVR